MCFTHGRSGTEYIFSALRKHFPCGHEIFNELTISNPALKKDYGLDNIEDYFSLSTIKKYMGRHNLPKIQFYQLLGKSDLLRSILDSWPIIFIGRRDLFQKTLSVFAGRYGKWHVGKNSDYEYLPFIVPVDEFKAYYKLSIDQEREFLSLSRGHLTLYYEDMATDLDGSCRKILDFIDVDHTNMFFETDYRKAVKDYETLVANYHELRDIANDIEHSYK